MLEKLISKILIVIIAAVVLILISQFVKEIWKAANKPQDWQRPSLAGIKTASVFIGTGKWQVEIADDARLRAKGLSGRKKLNDNKGMLFVFPEPGYYKFWMKEMNFPLDIIWIKGNKVVSVSANAPPLSLKQMSKGKVFYNPPEPVDKVLEINAGEAEKYNIGVGSPVLIR